MVEHKQQQLEVVDRKNNPDSLQTQASEEYNGNSWTAGNALPSTYGAVTQVLQEHKQH